MKKLISLLTLCVLSVSTACAAEQVIHVFLIGPGLVGKELLHQIHQGFTAQDPIEIRVVGLANSRSMLFDPQGIDLTTWEEHLAYSQEPLSLNAFIDQMTAFELPHSVFVDCTSHQSVADVYETILRAQIPIATPNKKGNSGALVNYRELKHLAEQNRVKFLYDANVGAGLPIIRMIQSLKRGGDTVTKVEAILSGTISYLFNTFDGTVPFSEIVRRAQKMGYTEPDPRDDLNGMDMARKFLILARESGLDLEMNAIKVDRFLPDECFEAPSVVEFYQKLADFDENFSQLAQQAKEKGHVLRFMGILENGEARLSLQVIGPEHPFYHLSQTDNIASISSRLYQSSPIVIKGPGAGSSVTALSVLSNIVEAGIGN